MFFIIGSFTGTLYFIFCSNRNINPLSIIFDYSGFMNTLINCFLNKAKILILTAVLAFTLFGTFIIPLTSGIYGFLLASSFCGLLSKVNSNANVFTFLSFLPIGLIFIPTLILYSSESMDLSSKFCGFSMNNSRDSNIYQKIALILILLIISLVLAFISSFIETVFISFS